MLSSWCRWLESRGQKCRLVEGAVKETNRSSTTPGWRTTKRRPQKSLQTSLARGRSSVSLLQCHCGRSWARARVARSQQWTQPSRLTLLSACKAGGGNPTGREFVFIQTLPANYQLSSICIYIESNMITPPQCQFPTQRVRLMSQHVGLCTQRRGPTTAMKQSAAPPRPTIERLRRSTASETIGAAMLP